MKYLYELTRNSNFKMNGEVWFFECIDGMYSRCYNSEGILYHLSATTIVEPYNV